MAAGQFTLYDSGHLSFFDGTFAFATDTIVCVLLSDTYTPASTHSTYADISADEITDADYAVQTVANATVTQSSGTVTVTCDPVSFGSAVTISAQYAVLVRRASTALASTDLLVGYVDLNSGGGMVSSTNSEFTVSPSASGLFTDA